MTDEQWVWLFVHQCIDTDEKLEGMCPSCREEVTSGVKKCSRCGKPVGGDDDSFINPNFDESRFNALKNGTDTDHVEDNIDGYDDIDMELIEQLLEDDIQE